MTRSAPSEPSPHVHTDMQEGADSACHGAAPYVCTGDRRPLLLKAHRCQRVYHGVALTCGWFVPVQSKHIHVVMCSRARHAASMQAHACLNCTPAVVQMSPNIPTEA
jgi:hypothetical protein